jgi:hypothetical protein
MSDDWGTITFDVPDILEDTRDFINSVAEFLVTMLDIALMALEFAKVFLVGLLDPIAALIQLIVDELKALLRDLRQMGLYMTGDWGLLTYPYDDLLGGFAEYERRMIARLTDRTDPSRPDLSGKTSILSIFFYLSVDISDIQRLIKFLKQLVKYFNQSYDNASGYPICQVTDVLYGASAATIMQAQDIASFFTTESTPPPISLVKWGVQSPTQRSPFNPFPPGPPGGFIVTVSTVQDGIQLVYDRPSSTGGMKPAPSGPGQVQGREYGMVKDSVGKPVVIMGGDEMLDDLAPMMQYNFGLESDGTIKPGAVRVYGLVPSTKTMIPLDQLKQGDNYYFQRTFYVSPAQAGAAWFTGEYSVLLKQEEMPRAGHVVTNSDGTLTIEDDGVPAVLYVRVACCAKNIADTEVFQYSFDPAGKDVVGDNIIALNLGALPTDKPAPTELGDWSAPRQVVFPNANTKAYLEALKTALMVLVLSRPDLTPLDTLAETFSAEDLARIQANKWLIPQLALERCGLEKFVHLADLVVGGDYTEWVQSYEDSDPMEWRKSLYDNIQKVAHDIYSKTGPMPEVEAIVAQQTEFLRLATWNTILSAAHTSDVINHMDEEVQLATTMKGPILDSLETKESTSKGFHLMAGLARNPAGIMGETGHLDMIMSSPFVTLDRLPQMQECKVGDNGPKWGAGGHATEVKAAEVPAFLAELPVGLRVIYEKLVQEDGSIQVPVTGGWDDAIMDVYAQPAQYMGSADISPVFYLNRSLLESSVDYGLGRVLYCRGLFAKANNGQIFREAAIALSMAAATTRSPDDGAWMNVRFVDTLPGIDKVVSMIVNWVEAVQKSLQSIIDAYLKYIGFIEDRIVEMQQLIRRINSMIQTILGTTLQIPKCSALTMVSAGTNGILADLVAAQTKPSDGPRAYGAGVAIVLPIGPTWIMDLISAALVTSEGSPVEGQYLAGSGITGISGVPDPVVESEEPDVL